MGRDGWSRTRVEFDGTRAISPVAVAPPTTRLADARPSMESTQQTCERTRSTLRHLVSPSHHVTMTSAGTHACWARNIATDRPHMNAPWSLCRPPAPPSSPLPAPHNPPAVRSSFRSRVSGHAHRDHQTRDPQASSRLNPAAPVLPPLQPRVPCRPISWCPGSEFPAAAGTPGGVPGPGVGAGLPAGGQPAGGRPAAVGEADGATGGEADGEAGGEAGGEAQGGGGGRRRCEQRGAMGGAGGAGPAQGERRIRVLCLRLGRQGWDEPPRARMRARARGAAPGAAPAACTLPCSSRASRFRLQRYIHWVWMSQV